MLLLHSGLNFLPVLNTFLDPTRKQWSVHLSSQVMTLKKVCMLWVHQEPWQQQLMLKYGNIISLMDATYKTTQYDLPLFFISVRTNTGYCVVAEFIVQSESWLHQRSSSDSKKMEPWLASKVFHHRLFWGRNWSFGGIFPRYYCLPLQFSWRAGLGKLGSWQETRLE